MRNPTALLCLLIGLFLSFPAWGQTDSSRDPAILIVVDPVAFEGDGILQSWQTINEQFGERYIQSRPHSKTYYSIKPVVSQDCAALRLTMNGTSVGESLSHERSRSVLTNSYSKFRAEQMVFIGEQGISFTPPVFDIQTDQSFERMKRPDSQLANTIGRIGFRANQDQIKAESDAFARQQLGRQIYQQNMRTSQNFAKTRHQISNQLEWTRNIQWRFSSDQNFVYLSSGPLHLLSPPSINRELVSVLVPAETIERWFTDEMAGQTYDNESIQDSYRRLAERFDVSANTQESENADDEDWVVHLEERPITLELARDEILCEIKIREYSSGSRSLEDLTVKFSYKLVRHSKEWHLHRQDEIDVVTSDPNRKLGARQQVLRTIIKKRVEKFIPEKLNLSALQKSTADLELPFEMNLKKITTEAGWLIVGFENN